MKRGLRALGVALWVAAGCTSTPPLARPVPRTIIEAHPRAVHALAFSPNGSLLASAGDGGTEGADEITMWVTASGERRITFANCRGVVSCLAFSLDGSVLAVGSTDGRIAVLDAGSGAERISFKGRASPVHCLLFSFDGSVLVSVSAAEGDADAEVCRWDVKRGVPRDKVTPQASPPFAISPEGNTLAWPVSGAKSGIHALDLETHAERLLSKVDVRRGDTLAFSSDGKWLAAAHLEDWSPLPNHCPYLYLVDARTGKIRKRSPQAFGARRGLALSHDANLLVRGVDTGLEVWDAKTLELRRSVEEVPERTAGPELLMFSPDDQTLVSSDGGGLVLLWDVPRLLEIRYEAAVAPRSK